MLRRRPLAHMSAKRRAVLAERAAFRADMIARRPRCELPALADRAARTGTMTIDDEADLIERRWRCQAYASEVHEILPRGRGGPFVPSAGLTADGVLCLCHTCHEWVTRSPRLAALIGAVTHGCEPTT